jgi:hypothetical protein
MCFLVLIQQFAIQDVLVLFCNNWIVLFFALTIDILVLCSNNGSSCSFGVTLDFLISWMDILASLMQHWIFLFHKVHHCLDILIQRWQY